MYLNASVILHVYYASTSQNVYKNPQGSRENTDSK